VIRIMFLMVDTYIGPWRVREPCPTLRVRRRRAVLVR